MTDIWPSGGPPQPQPSVPVGSGSTQGWSGNPNTQYIPPNQNYGGSRGAPSQPVRRPIPLLWIIGAVILGSLLIQSHRISESEVVIFAVLVPSIILHEIAHGLVALIFGDDTAKRAGRLTLNPLKHVDPIGTVLIPAVLALTSFGFWGYAKPVPVNVSKLRSPRNHGVLVALAGPTTNFALAGIAAAVFIGFHGWVNFDQGLVFNWAQVMFFLGLINVWVGCFNLLPIPPLDGSVFLERLLPRSMWPGYLRLRMYAMPLLFGVILLNSLHGFGFISALADHIQTWWENLLSP